MGLFVMLNYLNDSFVFFICCKTNFSCCLNFEKQRIIYRIIPNPILLHSVELSIIFVQVLVFFVISMLLLLSTDGDLLY